MPLDKSGKYNDFPEGFHLPEIPDEPTTVTYQVLDHLKFIEPVTKKPRYRSSMSVQPLSRIMIKKKPVLVGLVGGTDAQGNLNPYEIRRIDFNPDETDGLLMITIGAGVPANDELYQYLEICSENESNPYRDTSILPLFRKKDYVKEAKDRREKRDLERKAYDLARGLKGNDIREMAMLAGIDANRDLELVYDDVEDYAKANPQLFIDMNSDPDRDAKTVLAQGLNSGVLKIDTDKMAVTYSTGAEIMKITGDTERKAVSAEFVEWLKNQNNPAAVLKGLKAAVASKGKP